MSTDSYDEISLIMIMMMNGSACESILHIQQIVKNKDKAMLKIQIQIQKQIKIKLYHNVIRHFF